MPDLGLRRLFLLLASLAVCGLLFSAFATAECGEKPSLQVAPNPLKFNKQGEVKNITISNLTNKPVEELLVAALEPKDFQVFLECKEVELQPKEEAGDSCIEKVGCLKAGKTGEFIAWSEKTKVAAVAKLEC